MAQSYLVDKITTVTNRGQSSATDETGSGAVSRAVAGTTVDNKQVTSSTVRNSGARTNTRTTRGGTGGKGTTTNTGDSTTTNSEHESFSVQFSVRIKGPLVDPDVTNEPPPLTSPGGC